MFKHTCPECNNNTFTLVVEQLVDVTFDGDGNSHISDGPHGDMEWTEDSWATCNECHHHAQIKDMT